MKVINAFPVNSLSGTAPGQDPRNYYQWRGQQIVRKKGGNKGQPSSLFSQNTTYTNIATNAWNALSDIRKTAWSVYSEKMNSLRTKNESQTNPYTAFKNINYYSWFCGLGSWQLDPPHRAEFLNISFSSARTDPVNPKYIRLIFSVSNHDENSYIYLKTTQPHSGFLHSFRRSEIKPISEYQILSFAHPEEESSTVEYECNITQYNFIGNCRFWIEAVAIGPAWNVSKPMKFQAAATIL